MALLVSLAALALGFAAFMSTLRQKELKPGRVLQTRISKSYEGPPVSFPLDDFYMSRDSEGSVHAVYAYPPGFFGHNRGCRVVWSGDETVTTDDGQAGPGLFVDPCGGARFAADGRLLAGSADRGLDYFQTFPAVDGFIVDTRTLWCGRLFGVTYPDDPTATPTPPPSATPPLLTPTAQLGVATAAPGTASVTASPSATPSVEGTVTATATPDLRPKKCERASGSSKR